MASLPDLTITAAAWVDVTAAISSTTGTNLIVQNTSDFVMRIETAASAPAASAKTTGLRIQASKAAIAEPAAGESVFAIAMSRDATLHAVEQ